MTHRTIAKVLLSALIAPAVLAGSASAAQVKVTITNEFDASGPFLTPLFSAFHDGSFDFFNPGDLASASLEALAEEGVPDGLLSDAAAAGATTGVIVGTDVAPPPINPQETASLIFDVDPLTDRYFSFASMVIPSNDLFIGNGSPTAYEVFDAGGAFNDLTITVSVFDIWDAGTEANTNLGAAFNAAGGVATDTSDGIELLRNLGAFPPGQALSGLLNGQGTAAGTTIDIAPGNRALATIRFTEVSEVPLPAAAPLLLAAFGGLAFLRRQRRSKT